MRAVLRLFGSLLLLSCLAVPAAADGMRPLGGGAAPFMFAPTPPRPQFHGSMGQNRPIPRHILQGQVTRQFFVNPGPVPPLNGTIVPPFSVGGTVTGIDRFHNPVFFGKRRFVVGDDRFHRFHRFRRFPGVFPVVPFGFFEDVPDQVVVFADTNPEVDSGLEATTAEASVIPPAKPTWRSGKSALTGTLENPRVIVISPAQQSTNAQILTPSTRPMHAPQVVEVPQ
jgi:hypothetical protein